MSNLKSIDISQLLPASVAAIAIIGGVVLKNTSEQEPTGMMTKIGMYAGPALFLGGWALLLYVLVGQEGGMNIASIQYTLAVAMIAGSVMYVKMSSEPSQIISALFPLGWLLLGYTLSFGSIMDIGSIMSNLFSEKTLLFMGATLMVLVSMIVVLPWQREMCVVDGPGLPMFVAAWGMIIYGLST